ncbi:hypothetical protein HAX54_038669, partial [Datura stramonium]|nr:hypothetical protein [Datura stramonium]
AQQSSSPGPNRAPDASHTPKAGRDNRLPSLYYGSRQIAILVKGHWSRMVNFSVSVEELMMKEGWSNIIFSIFGSTLLFLHGPGLNSGRLDCPARRTSHHAKMVLRRASSCTVMPVRLS